MAGKSAINQAIEDAIVSTRMLLPNKHSYEFNLNRIHTLVQSAYESRSSYVQVRVPRERIQAVHHMSSDLYTVLDELYAQWSLVEKNIDTIKVLVMASLRAMGDPLAEDIRNICSATILKLNAMLPPKEYHDDEMGPVFESMKDMTP